MKKLFALLLVICLASLASATNIWLTDEGRAVPFIPGSSTIRLTISSDAATSFGLLNMDAIVTVTGGDVIVAAMNTSDCTAYGWDPTLSFDPIGLGTSTVEIGAGSFIVTGNLAPIIGYVEFYYTGGMFVVSIAGGTNLGGSMDVSFTEPVFSDGVVTIVPFSLTCWETDECAGQSQGDATCDGSVNLADLFALKAAWGMNAPYTAPHCCADFDQSTGVNLADLFILKAGWGKTGLLPATGNQYCP